MADKLPYAPLPVLEHAVRHNTRISFFRKGVQHRAEPHRITRAPRTGAIVLQAWLEDLGWRSITYCEIRGMEVLSERFAQRSIPIDKLARLE